MISGLQIAMLTLKPNSRTYSLLKLPMSSLKEEVTVEKMIINCAGAGKTLG